MVQFICEVEKLIMIEFKFYTSWSMFILSTVEIMMDLIENATT